MLIDLTRRPAAMLEVCDKAASQQNVMQEEFERLSRFCWIQTGSSPARRREMVLPGRGSQRFGFRGS